MRVKKTRHTQQGPTRLTVRQPTDGMFPTKRSISGHSFGCSAESSSSAPPPSASDAFCRLGFLGVRSWVPRTLLEELNAAVDRQGSRARMTADVISGNALQINMDALGSHGIYVADELCSLLISSPPVVSAAEALWGPQGTSRNGGLRIVSRTILEGGSEQIPHADSAFATALVAIVSMHDGQASTLFHVSKDSCRTAFSTSLTASDGGEKVALDAISVVARPSELSMRPGLDTPMDAGDGLIMSASVVHAGPGGVSGDGRPRRVAFIAIAPRSLPERAPPYNPRTQFHVVQYLVSKRRCEGVPCAEEAQVAAVEAWHKNHDFGRRIRDANGLVFEAIFEQEDVWRELGHDIRCFLMPGFRREYEAWIEANRRCRKARKLYSERRQP